MGGRTTEAALASCDFVSVVKWTSEQSNLGQLARETVCREERRVKRGRKGEEGGKGRREEGGGWREEERGRREDGGWKR